MLNQDFKEFIKSLNDNGVRYLVIGAYALDGKMIDMPLRKNAQKVLDRARAAGKN